MATGRPIDHVVLAVNDVDCATKQLEKTSFTPRAFRDDRVGTSNRLIRFHGRSFIEMLTVDPVPASLPCMISRQRPFLQLWRSRPARDRTARRAADPRVCER